MIPRSLARSWRVPAAIGLLCGTLSCGDGPTEPRGPRTAILSVVADQASADVGGLLITVSGGAVTSVRADQFPVLVVDSSAVSQSLLIRGAVRTGARVLQIHVADDSRPPGVVVNEVAAGVSGGYAALPTSAVQIRLQPQ